jgi:hypothetical protein
MREEVKSIVSQGWSIDKNLRDVVEFKEELQVQVMDPQARTD